MELAHHSCINNIQKSSTQIGSQTWIRCFSKGKLFVDADCERTLELLVLLQTAQPRHERWNNKKGNQFPFKVEGWNQQKRDAFQVGLVAAWAAVAVVVTVVAAAVPSKKKS